MHISPCLLLLLSACLLVSPMLGPAALAQQSRPIAARRAPLASGPHAIGFFDDWAAAIHLEAGDTVCYAFARASNSTPPIAGRGDVVLTVAERPGGGRDVVAISAGFAYSRNAAVSVGVEQTRMEFYTAQHSGFARDGHAAVQAFQRGRTVVARSPGPGGQVVVDRFSLRGFRAAYAAIERACPAVGKATR